MTEPVFIPHDVDSGPEPKPVTDETTTEDGKPAVTGNPLPQVSKTVRLPDGTEVEQKIQDVT